MKKPLSFSTTSLPVLITVLFFLFLLGGLLLRVYQADRDLGNLRLTEEQARMAAEAGLHYGVVRMRERLNQPGGGMHPSYFSWLQDLSDPPKLWRPMSSGSGASFRLNETRRLPGFDREETPLIDEAHLFRLMSEGRARNQIGRATGIVAATPLVKRFAVFNSLNEFYYGQPIQPWIRLAGGLSTFIEKNAELFSSGRLTTLGICHDPGLLVKMFQPGAPDPFAPVAGQTALRGNYGTVHYKRGGTSPCEGPLYCQTPIVVDSHVFKGPVQTASFFYHRGESRPTLELDSAVLALSNSKRIQSVLDKAEGDLPENGVFIDESAIPRTSFMAPWRPNFQALREFAKSAGIYIDANGKGFCRGAPTEINYHVGSQTIWSETYFTPTSIVPEQDAINESYIVLSTATKFDGVNNLDRASLKGVNIVFSELSIMMRGEVEGDVMIVTPRHIYITGSINPDASVSLLLAAGDGVALHTGDLEQYFSRNPPSEDVRDAARQWIVRAALYKPGAGWYGSWSRKAQGDELLAPRNVLSGAQVSLTIAGACLEGSLSRWIEHAAPEGVRVKWVPGICDRLPVEPMSVNLVRTRLLSGDQP